MQNSRKSYFKAYFKATLSQIGDLQAQLVYRLSFSYYQNRAKVILNLTYYVTKEANKFLLIVFRLSYSKIGTG